MSTGVVRRLGDLRLADAPVVGGKAASLGELIASGVRVPDGVVLGVDTTDLPDAERAELLASAATALGGERFAVRSSGIAEDGADRSFAGQYESVLGVPPAGLAAASGRVLDSVRDERVATYGGGSSGAMAVIVQRMVDAVAAGVALTADPVNGDRATSIVTAVKGLAEPLVGGEVPGDEWRITQGGATLVRQIEGAIDAGVALAVAGEARRIAELRGAPQDVEWALGRDGLVWIVQARPMTALPREVSWNPPVPGAFSRSFRFGEWISEPVTPLFESWLLTAMEDRFHEGLLAEIGQRIPRPFHVVVNGWYFYSLNWATPGAFLRNAPRMLAKLARSPRSLSGIMPATVRHAIPTLEREWRNDLQPRYRAAVAAAQERVETLAPADLPTLVDELASLAGEYFLSIAALSGAAYKTELNLAGFHRQHLRDAVGWSHLPLVSGFETTVDRDVPAIASLDWWFEPTTLGPEAAAPPSTHVAVVDAREAAEAAARTALGDNGKRLRTFERLLADAQHLLAIRDEQTRELAIAWPVMRRAVLRLGEALVASDRIDEANDVFFLTRAEALGALHGDDPSPRVDVRGRRSLRGEQARIVPPLVVGRLPRMVESMWKGFTAQVGGVRSERALVSGAPASAGRATGLVRVVRGPAEFESLQAGEILVAPITAPAWTPLFTRAAAIVTDVGSAASHASLVAREYGIPAVVGTGDATARLRTGMRVTVDGSTGTVEAA